MSDRSPQSAKKFLTRRGWPSQSMQPGSLLQEHQRHHDDDEDLLLFRELERKEREASSQEPQQRAPGNNTSGEEEDIFSSSEWDQHDYDWLVVPPAAPPLIAIPICDDKTFRNGASLSGSSDLTTMSRHGSSRSESPSVADGPLAHAVHSRSPDSQGTTVALIDSTKSSSRKSSFSMSGPSATRSTTPVSRSLTRPSTPTRSASGASLRSSTPTGRSTTPSNCVMMSTSSPRVSTPIKRQANPSLINNPASASGRISPLLHKVSVLPSKSMSSSRPSSPVTGRTRQPTDHPAVLVGTPQERPSNLRVDRLRLNARGSMTLRTSSVAAAAAAKPVQSEPADGGAHTKQPSRSPFVTRGRFSSPESLNGQKSSATRTGRALEAAKEISGSSAASSRMVDRPMPSRKPAVVSQERISSAGKPQAVKSLKSGTLHGGVKLTTAVQESNGFGQNISRKSLDMALRHMDIQGINKSSVQSFMSNVPAASLYSVRSRAGRGGNSNSSITSSPMATSSYASSEHGMSPIMDPESSEYCETSSDMDSRASSTSHSDMTMALSHERKVSHWLASPGYLEDANLEAMQIFEQGLARASSPESLLLTQQEGAIDSEDLTLEPI